jgi:formate hydrogenlyase subunit 3/multisubunit Na+/H+ antiporter MnhD subunit
MPRRRPPSNSGTFSRGWTSSEHVGKLLIILGVVIAGIGALISVGVPLGRLPGDIVVRRDNFTFYFPLTTSILVSVVVTLLFTFLRR